MLNIIVAKCLTFSYNFSSQLDLLETLGCFRRFISFNRLNRWLFNDILISLIIDHRALLSTSFQVLLNFLRRRLPFERSNLGSPLPM